MLVVVYSSHMNTKKCCVCKADLATDQFYKNAARSDGLDTVCKACRMENTRSRSKTERGREINRQSQRRRRADPEIRAAEAEARKTPEGRRRSRERMARYRKSVNGIAYQSVYRQSPRAKEVDAARRQRKKPLLAAHKAITLAIYHGTIPKASTLTCAECGGDAREYHHHNGYEESHWLDVIPVCVPCHRKLNRITPLSLD